MGGGALRGLRGTGIVTVFFFFGKNWGDNRKFASLDAIAQWGGHEVEWRRGWEWGGVKAA